MQQVFAKPPGLSAMPFYVHETGDKYISERIRRTGIWEPFESRVLLSLLRRGDQVLDIGANIGWYTVGAAQSVGETGRIFAFEPDQKNFELLEANILASRLHWVSAEMSALGRADGTASIAHSPDNQGDHRLRGFEPGASLEKSTRKVPVVAIDHYLAEKSDFDLAKLRIIKIDVQGFEREVLLGAKQLLANLPTRTVIFIEFDPALLDETGANASRDVVEMLSSMGRGIFAIRRPIWRVAKLTAEDLRTAAASVRRQSIDLIVVHPHALRDFGRALPLIPRLLSARDLR